MNRRTTTDEYNRIAAENAKLLESENNLPSQLAVTEAALAAANARIAVLEAALRKYGSHTVFCEKPYGTKCTCGLDQLTEALRPTQQPAPESPAIPTLTPYAQRQPPAP